VGTIDHRVGSTAAQEVSGGGYALPTLAAADPFPLALRTGACVGAGL
jgi:hypothetical protein